ncbi:MAG: hypothetical protein AAFQ80_07100 [Cyanobacteria bacterium J06621_8]
MRDDRTGVRGLFEIDEITEIVCPDLMKVEVRDFADSQPGDRHYLIDSLSGIVQFGPLIREPDQLRTATETRIQYQTHGQQPSMLSSDNLEQQYGAIPPKG